MIVYIIWTNIASQTVAYGVYKVVTAGEWAKKNLAYLCCSKIYNIPPDSHCTLATQYLSLRTLGPQNTSSSSGISQKFVYI